MALYVTDYSLGIHTWAEFEGTNVSFRSSIIVVRVLLQYLLTFLSSVGLHSFTTGDSQVTESIAKSGIFIQATLMTIVLRMYLVKTAAVFSGVFL